MHYSSDRPRPPRRSGTSFIRTVLRGRSTSKSGPFGKLGETHMSQLRIFSYLPNPRIWKATIVARLCNVELDLRGASPKELPSWLWDFDAHPLSADDKSETREVHGHAGFQGKLRKTAAFLQAHPFGTVPAAFSPDGRIGIFESNCIMRAVARVGGNRCPSYGRGPYEASRVDSFLDASLVFARDSQIYLLGLMSGSLLAETHARVRDSLPVIISTFCAAHVFRRLSLGLQFVEQRFCVLQVGGVEALGEPVVDLGEHRARFAAAFGIAQQPCKAHSRTQLQPLCRLASRDFDGLAKTLLRLLRRRGIAHQDRFAPEPIKSRLSEVFPRPFNSGKLLLDNCKSLVGAADTPVDLREGRLDLRRRSGSRLQLGDPLLRLAKLGHCPPPECTTQYQSFLKAVFLGKRDLCLGQLARSPRARVGKNVPLPPTESPGQA